VIQCNPKKEEIVNAINEIISDKFKQRIRNEINPYGDGRSAEKIVKKLIEDGRKKLGEKSLLYITKDADKKVAGHLGIQVDGYVESCGGVVIKSSDGRVTLDHTFDGILKREKDKMRLKVGKVLFP